MVLLLAGATPVWANGRSPYTGQIALDPVNPAHWVVRTTYGLISTIDSGKSWQWICETAIGYEGNADPFVVISKDGSILATTPLGTKVSHDGGCDWQTPADIKGENDGIDLVRDATDTASVLLLSRSIVGTDPNTPNLLRLFATHDNGKTWNVQGNPVALIASPQTLEVAPSRPQRIYVSGATDDLLAVSTIWRSDDAGKSWIGLSVQGGAGGNSVTVTKAYIAAVAIQNPDQIYLRAQTSVGDQLWRSDDGGEHWQTIFSKAGNLYGFAQSPDGAQIAVGVLGGVGGLWLAATKDPQFQKANVFSALCLAWNGDGLYACAGEDEANMSLGRSTDNGATFFSLYKVRDLKVMQCPPSTRTGSLCPGKFPMLQVLLGIEDTSPDPLPPPVAVPPTKTSMCAAARVADGPCGVGLSLSILILAVGCWKRGQVLTLKSFKDLCVNT